MQESRTGTASAQPVIAATWQVGDGSNRQSGLLDRRRSRQMMNRGSCAATSWIPKRRYRSLSTTAVLLLLLGLRGVAPASVCSPGVTGFLELDQSANLGFDSLPGASFDWANSGASATPRNCVENASGVITCKGHCSGTITTSCSANTDCPSGQTCVLGGIFDGGQFVSSTSPPNAPVETPAALDDPTIAAASFGVDPLSVDVTSCGGGDPTVYTGVGGEVNGDLLNSETFGTGSVPNKDEISNAYAIAHKIIANPTAP